MTLTDCSAIIALVVGAAACMLAGCDNRVESGPPDLRFGRDECAECKMSIIDEKSAAAARVQTPDGPDVLLFDDLGCLLDLERWSERLGVVVTERWTRDYGSRQWVRAESAIYVFSQNIRTPMGSWIAAYSIPADAEATQREAGGDLLSYEQLVVRRGQWMEERYGKRQP